MISKTLLPTLVLASLPSLTAPALARPDAAGDAWLARIDLAQVPQESQIWDLEISHKNGATTSVASAILWIKGEKRHLEITSPSQHKGVKLLILGKSDIYSYVPEFGKVRRVVAQTPYSIIQSLWDTRMMFYPFSPSYSATIQSSNSTETLLVASQRPALNPDFPKLEITASTNSAQPTKIAYFGPEGKIVLSETRIYGTEGDRPVLKSLTLTNPNLPNVQTQITIKRQRSTPINDDVFSRRNLGG